MRHRLRQLGEPQTGRTARRYRTGSRRAARHRRQKSPTRWLASIGELMLDSWPSRRRRPDRKPSPTSPIGSTLPSPAVADGLVNHGHRAAIAERLLMPLPPTRKDLVDGHWSTGPTPVHVPPTRCITVRASSRDPRTGRQTAWAVFRLREHIDGSWRRPSVLDRRPVQRGQLIEATREVVRVNGMKARVLPAPARLPGLRREWA